METKKERMIRQLRAKGIEEAEIENRVSEAFPEESESEIFTIPQTESGEEY